LDLKRQKVRKFHKDKHYKVVYCEEGHVEENQTDIEHTALES